MGENRILDINGAILTSKELEKYLEKIGAAYNIKQKTDKKTYPIPRMMNNYYVIKQVYDLLNEHVKLGIAIHPAGEWILDNFYVIEENVKSIQKEISLKKYKNFVGISNGKYAGFARVYVLAGEIVNYTDNKINAEDLENYLSAYQTKKTLNMDEIWNIGIFLQICIIENIRQICEKIYISQIEKYKVEAIVEKTIEKKESTKFNINNSSKNGGDVKYPFIEYLSYKLKKYGRKAKPYLEILEDIVEKTGSTVSEVIKKEHFDIAINKISIGNCITSIKKIQRINFLEIFEKINCVEELLNKDPAKVYEKMDYKTKDYYRQKIKEISKKTKISELYITKKLLELAHNGKSNSKKQHIGYYLFGKNVKVLYKKIGAKIPNLIDEKQKVKLYISSIVFLTMLFSILIMSRYYIKIPKIFSIIGVILLIIPVSEIVIQLIQYILGKFVKPKLIPKLNFSEGIDKQNSTMVVIPTILTDKEKVQELMRKLEVFYLANKSENLYFCLLGDATESKRKIEQYDNDIVQEGISQVERLNKKYQNQSNYPIFNFVYRKRKWNEKQETYLGWERKRGALYEFVQLLKGNLQKNQIDDKFWINTIPSFEKCNEIKYVITLDSDTDLILNSAFELVGAMAHILNKPEVKNGKVRKGYGIIQPRVGVNIDVSYKNKFTQIFAGSGGIDSYTNAISDTYQDDFGEGIFTGKGIFDVNLYDEILKNKIPENTVLSHDLLEGCYLRCGLSSDILLMDGYPTKYTSFMARLARWIRGDWQIAKWIRNSKLNLLSKYKIFDNLRRSLLEISVIICEIYFLILDIFFKIGVCKITSLLTLSIILPFILEILNLIVSKKDGEQKQITFTPKIGGYLGSFYRGIITIRMFAI